MLPVVWRETARRQLAEIVAFIAEDNPPAARRLKERIEAVVVPLAQYPYLYPRGRVAGTRELVAHPNYLIVYKVAAERVEIVAVLHARRQYP
ncbi:type II toxin-antitoxin system RelE/ParE family toxin [Salinisphaera hydrothermalis]|uniref:Plasmid stabilization system n=1 Tax=Salinisphaera hydrothermalis (strain C41B8) TaxID=1304275 RepID=A0A084ILD5_SALHC|nr:type II toxin-antitoxin system RelE/ParE family toxin [Salinisphaera hydrothermalis]KEZ77519.1 plasmid stabilization system [Salinisphaera hydrothermalis C41B8]